MKPAEEWVQQIEPMPTHTNTHAHRLHIVRAIQADAKRDCAEHLRRSAINRESLLANYFDKEADRLEGK